MLASILAVVLSLLTAFFFLVFLPTYVSVAAFDYYILEKDITRLRAVGWSEKVVRLGFLGIGLGAMSATGAWLEAVLGVLPPGTYLWPFILYVFFLGTCALTILNVVWIAVSERVVME